MLRSAGFRSGKGSPYWIPVRRSAAASPSTAANATGGPPHRLSVGSDLGRRRTRQLRDVRRPDDHRIDACALELSDLIPARDIEIRDRQLPGRDIGQQVENSREWVVAIVVALRREEQELRVQP